MNKKAAKTATIVMLQTIALILVLLGFAIGMEWLMNNGHMTAFFLIGSIFLLGFLWLGVYFSEK